MDKLLFTNDTKSAKDLTSDLRSLITSYCIDTSGSTGGAILRCEIKSATNLSEYLQPAQIIGWNHKATPVKNFGDLTSRGLTKPSSFLRFLSKTQLLVLYTDGQIPTSDMAKFKTEVLEELEDIPILIFFAVSRSFDYSIATMQNQINMSIPEAFLSLSNNVGIVVCNGGMHKLLMAKGCFSDLGPNASLQETMLLKNLPDFLPEKLLDIKVTPPLPSHVILIPGIGPLDLNKLNTTNPLEIPTKVLVGLCNRMLMPKIDLHKLHKQLKNALERPNEEQPMDTIRDKIYNIVANGTAGSDAHKQLVEEYKTCKNDKKSNAYDERAIAVSNLFNMLAEYQRDSVSIVMGSNRANRAGQMDTTNIDNVSEDDSICIDCPIMMDKGTACLLVKKPEEKGFTNFFTSDYAIGNPFELGTTLAKLITPKLTSLEFAKHAKQNPFNRDEVFGYLPLSNIPYVIMQHMSKLFGGNKRLWHFVRAYVAMMVKVVNEPWMDEYKSIVAEHLTILCNVCPCTNDFKENSTQTTLVAALQHTLTNYGTCLRDRSPGDIEAIVKLSTFILPTFKFEVDKIQAMASFLREFMNLLKVYKSGKDMTEYVMNVDEIGHYESYKPGLRGLISQLLWKDQDTHKYKSKKPQDTINYALTDFKYGPALTQAFRGLEWDEKKTLEIALPEPNTSHDEEPRFWTWTQSELICCYCGEEFETSAMKFKHLRAIWGPYFYNGALAVKNAIEELLFENKITRATWDPNFDGSLAGVNEDHCIFTRTMKILQRKYGKDNGALHTQNAKQTILLFIKSSKTV